MKSPCIYKITSPTGKIYIGQTRNLQKRLKYYKSLDCRQQRKLYHSLKKYGFDNHRIEVIYKGINESIALLNDIEIYLIAFFNSTGSKGLNITEGGDGTKGVQRRRGKDHPMFGKKLSAEWKQKLSESHKGIIPTKETLIKRSISLKGKTRTNEQKSRLSASKLGSKNPNSLLTFQYTKEGVFVNKFESASLASKQTNIPHANICECAKGKRKTAGGFIWKYLN